MSDNKVSAIAHPNIALIKYWGNQSNELRIPSNNSISMNLGSLTTRTSVEIDYSLTADEVVVNGELANKQTSTRISRFLNLIRKLSNHVSFVRMSSTNNFPTGSGIASSASGFAALALAASRAYQLELSEMDLSRLARMGSGSACRSIPAGFVEWQAGTTDEDSYATSFAEPEYWGLVDIIAIVDSSHKKTGSTEGHHLAPTSPLQNARIEDVLRRINLCKRAILDHDFANFALIVEQDCMLMHSVMMTSSPALLYWQPASLEIIQHVLWMRDQGLHVCFTIDAGPNVHVITELQFKTAVEKELMKIGAIQSILTSNPGGAAYISG